jgi:hypothetical protein
LSGDIITGIFSRCDGINASTVSARSLRFTLMTVRRQPVTASSKLRPFSLPSASTNALTAANSEKRRPLAWLALSADTVEPLANSRTVDSAAFRAST